MHTDLFCHTGSCIANLNCFPPRAAGFNFWFFIAVSFGGECWCKAKCEMLLHKKTVKRTWKIVDFLRNGEGGDMLHDQRQLSRTRTIIFRRSDTSPTSKSRRRWPGNHDGRSKIRNLHLFMLVRSQLTLRRWLRGWQRLPEIAQTAHCRRQTYSGRWPSNPNGRSKFRNLFVYVSKIATNALAAAPRLMAADGDRSNGTLPTSKISSAAARRWPGMIEVPQLWKFMPTRSSKTFQKHLFAIRSSLLRWHCALSFSYYHSQRLFFSPTKVISRRPWPH